MRARNWGNYWRTNSNWKRRQKFVRQHKRGKRQENPQLWIFLWVCTAVIFLIMIPGILVKKFHHNPTPQSMPSIAVKASAVEHNELAAESAATSLIIPIYLTKEQKIERVPLEDYIAGVVAAEMPIEFELEALKAQAIAARTYIIRRIAEQDFSNMPTSKAQGAWVTDTVAQQAYLTDEHLRKKWGESYAANHAKIIRAVTETKDWMITYENKPINATFFSTSNGYTENSEDYWGDYIPYLRSVKSPWDAKVSPEFKQTITLPFTTFIAKLGLSNAVPASEMLWNSKKVEFTEGHRVKKVRIAGKYFSGREVRERLNLSSSQFQWRRNGTNIEITTTGYGHGVGMSQWGANGMALEGKTAADILKHYYTGIELKKNILSSQ